MSYKESGGLLGSALLGGYGGSAGAAIATGITVFLGVATGGVAIVAIDFLVQALEPMQVVKVVMPLANLSVKLSTNSKKRTSNMIWIYYFIIHSFFFVGFFWALAGDLFTLCDFFWTKI